MGKAAKGGKKLPSAPLGDKKKKAKKRLGKIEIRSFKVTFLNLHMITLFKNKLTFK